MPALTAEFRILRIVLSFPRVSELVLFNSLFFLVEWWTQMQKVGGGRSAALRLPAIKMQNDGTEEISREEYEALLIAAGKYGSSLLSP